MSKEQKELYYEQQEKLKENLLSADASAQIQDLLRSSRVQEELKQGENYESPLIQPEISDFEDEAAGVGLTDYYNLNNNLFTNNKDFSIDQKQDPYSFFKQASNQIDRPVSSIKHFCKHPNDPDTFATLTVASKFFRDKDLQLKEFMCQTDYEYLTKLRLNNYISILRILTKIDETLYSEVKDRLFKIYKVCACLGMNAKGSDIYKVFKRLVNETQIYDLEQPFIGAGEESQFSINHYIQAFLQIVKDEEAQESFLSQSKTKYRGENFTNFLLNEEEKWKLRAKWIEETFEKISINPQTQDWSSWIEAQVGSLSDLDILFKNRQSNNRDLSDEVFYLYDFLEAQQQLHGSKPSQQEEKKLDLKDMNGNHLQEKYDYPNINFSTSQACNDDIYSWIRRINVRSKFSLKIQHREKDTEYFLQVFKRRNFGNEKIYEKRLNLREQSLLVRNMEFQQDPGNFILLQFVIKNKNQKIKTTHHFSDHNVDNVVNCVDELHYYFGSEKHYGSDDSDDEKCINDNHWQNPDSIFNRQYGQRISLIFPIQEQQKNPLLLQPNSEILGFFGNSKFLTYQKVNKGLNVMQKNQFIEEKSNPHESQVLRIYEHDLKIFEKISQIDLHNPYTNVTRADVITKRFGRLIDGSFYYIHEKNPVRNERNFVFMKNREEIPIEIEHKIKNQKDKVRFIEKFYPNEKGDKILMISKCEKYNFIRFSLEQYQSKKRFKQDDVDFSEISEYIGKKEIKQLKFGVQTVENDFLIIILKLGDDSGPMHIFLNDKFICEGERLSGIIYEPNDISYQLNKGKISKLFCRVNPGLDRIFDLKDLQNQQYEVFDIDNPKKEWYKVSYSLLNQDVTFVYPHLFFIYNHDQLYIKDMSQPRMQGYFYMNNFLGIRKNERPLCVQTYKNENSLITNVPIVDNTYSENQFYLRIVQLQTLSEMSNPYQFLNSLILFDVFTLNEKVSQVNKIPSQLITDEKGKLEKDVRIYNKNNSLVIEKIHKNKCIQRAIINHFDELNLSERDVTNFRKNNDTKEAKEIMKGISNVFTPSSQRFITIQKQECVEIFLIDKRYSGYQLSHVVLSDLLKKVWEFQSDEASNQIQDILVDPVPKDLVDFYLLLQKGQMKKISYSIKDGSFNEYQHFYNIEKGLKVNNPTEFGKQVFIANSILYSQDSIIELRGEIFHQDKKSQVGQIMPELPTNAKVVAGFSPFDGTFIVNEKVIGDEMIDDEDLIMKYVVLPLYNTRMIPQFYQTQFYHPIVPLVDLIRGFSCIFTLNLNQTLIIGSEVLSNYNSQFCRYLNYNNLSPGLLIRFFNGVEHKIPIKEKIIRVDRFTISNDGYKIVIQGLQIKENYQRSKLDIIIINGFFIYEISKKDITKVFQSQLIQFAEFSFNDESKPQQQNFELGEFQFDHITFGNYDFDQDLTYHTVSTAENYAEKFKFEDLEQSDDDFDNLPTLTKTNSGDLSLIQNLDEQPILLKTKSIQEIKKVPKFQKVKINFLQFDLPAPDEKFLILNILDNVFYPKKKMAQEDQYEISIEYRENQSDKNIRLKKIHENLRIKINEQSHFFIFNRLSNKVYFFYKFDPEEDYKLFTFAFSDIIVEGADSSENYVIFWSSDNFVLYDISTLKENLSDQKNIYGKSDRSPEKIQEIDFIQLRQKSPISTENGEEKTQQVVQPYLFQIISCKIIFEKIIFQIKEEFYNNSDSFTNYVKIFDIKKSVLINYFEYDKIMLSGDKQFVWFPTQNRVYDIQNNLSTLFIWPGGEINCHGNDAMDVFNVTEDKSIMATHGILYLAFNLHSSYLQSQNIKNVIPSQNDYKSRNLEFFFNLPGPSSLLNTLLNGDVQFPSIFYQSRFSSGKNLSNIDSQIQREHLLAKLNNYILTNGLENPMNKANYAQYLLSYWEKMDNNQIAKNIFQVLFSHNSQRTAYLVEEILSSVVQMVDCPITKCLINKSFIDFLKTLDTSRAFREFLNKSITQTASMKITTKYPIVTNDQGYTLKSCISPIMDEGFREKFEEPQTQVKEVMIQYIFLGDLLTDKGKEILKILNDMKYLGNLDIPFLNYIVKYQWNIVQGLINRQTLIPFFGFLFFFTIYSMYFVSYIDDVPSITSDSSQAMSFCYYVLILVQLVFVGYFMNVEIRHLMKLKIEYITNLLNYIDMIINLLCLSVYMFDWMGDMQTYLRPVASSTLIIVWFKLFYYLRAYDSTSQLIRMIIEIVKDIRFFLLVLFIGIFGFAGGFYILQFGLSQLEKDNDSLDHLFVGHNPILAVLYIYQLVMGNYNLGNFSEYEKLNPFEFYYIWFLFVMSCLFLVIVLMNLLIAIMGATFLKVQDNISNLQIRELVLLISENESLFSRSQEFKDSQFLIIVKENQSTASKDTTIDEQISLLRQELSDKVALLESQQVRLQQVIQNDMKRKFHHQQTSYKNMLANLKDQMIEEITLAANKNQRE